ncbi:GIY-YIG nuclease family protein [Dehalobacterium formicoaceticum]|uniref:GIY-YIG nuclease family protein n=1 Tax=Dehalobacterium formicoaceticum TaxID=51515 RepID=UPI0031F6D798
MNLIETAKELPQNPGVYMMRDAIGNIIYVGKAKNLKHRVSQYFHNQKDRAPKVAEMIGHIDAFNYLVTDTELDALIDECRLIKELQPRYNRLMKNPQKYIYLKIPAEKFPRVTRVHQKTDDGSVYLGPFTSQHRVDMAIQYLNEFYPIRKCTGPGLVKRNHGCLYYQLGSCLGVCTGQVEADEYRIHMEKIIRLLKGNDKDAVSELLQKLNTAAEDLKFEKASRYRDYYFGLKHIFAKQQLAQSSSKNKTILAVDLIDQKHYKIFLIKGNKLLDRKMVNTASANHADQSELIQSLKDILTDQLVSVKSSSSGLTQQDLDEAQIINSYLKKHINNILSFWIPSSHLKDASGIDATVKKIVSRITPFSK